MADTAAAAPVAPVSAQYTLLRVKRKRDDSPVASLLLTGETEPQPGSSKRSALADIRTLLDRTRLADDDRDSKASTGEGELQTGRRAQLRRVFKLVGTVPHAAASPDDALLSRIAAMQSARQAKAVHPSIAPGGSVSDQRDRLIEAQQQRAAAARTEKLKEARAATSAAAASTVPPAAPYASAASPAPFTFLDVSITKHFPASAAAPALSPQGSSAAAFQSVSARPVVAETAEQQHRDHVFSRAMSLVKAMPEKDKMAAYASLLDDYWQATAGSTGTGDAQQPSFTQQLQRPAPQPAAAEPQSAPRIAAGERIDLSSLAPRAQRLYAGAAAAQPPQAAAADDDAQYVYDVYRVEADDGEGDGAEAGADGGSEVASVVVDSRVAGWFGLVADEEDVADSDEDDEDENREGWEGNDYPEDESEDEDEDEDERGREEERVVAGDEDEEFYRLRQQLKRSKNELIAMSDEGDDDSDNDDDDEGSDEGDEADEYARGQYRAGHYDNEI